MDTNDDFLDELALLIMNSVQEKTESYMIHLAAVIESSIRAIKCNYETQEGYSFHEMRDRYTDVIIDTVSRIFNDKEFVKENITHYIDVVCQQESIMEAQKIINNEQ
jgi:hypothetical protein